MVAFITIVQVNLVMSILLYVMFLAYLYGISASTMDKQRPTQDPIHTLIIKLLQADISRRQKQDDSPPASNLSGVADHKENDSSGVSQPVTDIPVEFLRHRRRYNSPRVLLSERPPLHPPPFYLMDDFVSNHNGNKTRQKRHIDHKSYNAEFGVCDSVSYWETKKTTAIDINGREVTVLDSFIKDNRVIKQYFYETECNHTHNRRGCRGIDQKHWNSECKPLQTFVRAYIKSESLKGSWGWIRINTSCVCAITRKRRT